MSRSRPPIAALAAVAAAPFIVLAALALALWAFLTHWGEIVLGGAFLWLLMGLSRLFGRH
jgi:hypothetical protein